MEEEEEEEEREGIRSRYHLKRSDHRSGDEREIENRRKK